MDVLAPARTRVRLTLVDPRRTAGAVDVLVDAPAGTRLAAVRADLDRLAPHLAGRALPDDGVLGRPPLLDGALLVADRRPDPPRDALLEVHAVAGPAAGERLALPPGQHLLGRGPDAAVRVDDPDVSRLHAALDVRPDGVRVTDLGATNGTAFEAADGTRTALPPDTARPWPDGAVLVVGGTRLRLRAAADEAPPAAVTEDGVGHLLVNRAPRVRAADPARSVRFPEPPAASRPGRLPWPALLVPALVAVPMAFVWRQPAFLLLAALTPLALLVQHVLERRGGRRDARRAAAEHAAAVDAATADLAAACAADLADLDAALPDLGVLAAAAARPTRRLWERGAQDDDALVVRVGCGPVAARVRVEGPGPAAAHATAPVALDLAGAAVTGLAGPRARDVARAFVAQVAVLHSPRDVRVTVLAADDARRAAWDWTSWLPHTAPGTSAPARSLVVLDGAAALRRDPAVADLLARAAAGRHDRRDRTGPAVTVLCLEDGESALPAECAATLVTTGDGARLRVRGEPDRRVVPDGAAAGWAARVARDLARLRDATPAPAAAALPDAVALTDLAGLPAAQPHDWPALLAQRWRRAPGEPPPLRVPAGVTTDGPWVLDLRRDGPHALVGGTTGSGKSELLRSLVAGLALTHPPDEVQVLLVDYKGGTAFAGLAGLPHVAGLVTDLDAHLARRALTSLRAELRRREAALRAAGAADLDAYDRAVRGRVPDAGRPLLPRLVVVVDEFRVLAEELPELLTGLVRVAALGRSLGVHLVLATQRPAGAVSADLRANVNLRLALRVRDVADSTDVVEAPDAARLPADRPGRAVLRVGGGSLVTVQTALVGGGPGGRPGAPTVRLLSGDGHRDADDTDDADDAGTAAPDDGTRVRALVDAVRTAAAARPVLPVDPLWLPPLPERVLRDDLPGGPPVAGPGAVPSDGPPRILLGLADRPDEQRRAPLAWDLADGHLGVCGAPGSGRTTALRTVVAGAAGAGLHVHVLHAGGPAPVAAGASVPGTVVPVTDPERAARLLRHLARDPLRAPWTLLVVDGWEAVCDALLGHDRGRPLDDLVAAARDRGADGLRLAVAGGRSVLTGALGGVLGTRALLRPADPTDLVVAGLPAAHVPSVMPPGRVVVLGSPPVEAQVALLAEDPSPAAQADALARRLAAAAPTDESSDPPSDAASDASSDAGLPPLRLVALPRRVALDTLPAAAVTAVPGHREVVVGLGGDAAVPVALPLPPGEVLLVAGAPGAGRTTALAVVAERAAAAGLVVHAVVPGDVHLPRRPDVVLVDDADRLPPDTHDAVLGLVAQGATAVVAATAADAAVAFRGLLAAARAARTGVLLGALGPGESEVLGVREAGARNGPPGRGLLVVRGRAVAVQVAAPGPGGPT